MSSYGLLARLSNVENDTSDLQASLNSLDAEKQDSLENANVVGGQPIKVGSVLNKIGTKDNTLTVETTGSIIKLGVDKNVMQEKLEQVAALTGDVTSQALLVGDNVKRVSTKDTGLTIETDANIVKLAVDKTVMQVKLTATGDATSSKAVLNNSTVRSVGVDETMTVSEANNVINLAVNKEKVQEKLTTIADNDGADDLLLRADNAMYAAKRQALGVCQL